MLELVKKNIHMDCIKAKAGNQITVEDDVNIPDLRPDIDKVIFHSGVIKIEEAKAGNGQVTVRGSLAVNILYTSDEEEEPLGKVETSLPFEEQFHMDGVETGDAVYVRHMLEDLSIGIINSRKISIRALMTLELCVREIFDEPAAVDLETGLKAEYRRKPLQIMETAVCKKDIFRFRHEETLPTHLPNVFEVLYGSVMPGALECIAGEDKLLVRGNVKLFFLYSPDGEEGAARFFETVVPIQGEVPCSGMHDMMIPCVGVSLGSVEYEVKPDFDGEDRVFAIEAVFDLDIKAYEEKVYEILADMYGITKEIETQCKEGSFMNLLQKNSGKARIKERMQLDNANLMALIHHEETAMLEDVEIEGSEMTVMGNVHLRCLYTTNEDMAGYGYMEQDIPFIYTLEIGDTVGKNISQDIQLAIEQMDVTVLDSSQMECNGIISVTAVVFEEKKEPIITGAVVSELDGEKMKNLPGMVIYVVKEGDSLWQIGKEYYIPVEAIKAMNGLTKDEIQPGDKLLLMKNAAGEM
ncbi:MAG: SPOCS domain-containing protein [Lachnospiraceae bacterium]